MSVQTQLGHQIILQSKPTLEQLKVWWAALQQDHARDVVYTDLMPRELSDFTYKIKTGDTELIMFLVSHGSHVEVGGAFYLHDYGEDRHGRYAWLGTYILPKYRRLTLSAWEQARLEMASHGFRRIFVATLATNRHVQLVLRRAGFTKLGCYQDWGYFGGCKQSVYLYSLQPEDGLAAWAAAERRSRGMHILFEQRRLLNSIESIDGQIH